MHKPTLYIAGPMTGIAQFNFPLFEAAARSLRADGFTIVSPHEMDSEETRKAAWDSPDGKLTGGMESWGDCLARDVKMLADGVPAEDYDAEGNEVANDTPPLSIDGIAFLPGWQNSRGARLEAFVGLLTGKLFFTVRVWEDDEDGPFEAAVDPATSEWVEHMLASTWGGVKVYRTGAE